MGAPTKAKDTLPKTRKQALAALEKLFAGIDIDVGHSHRYPVIMFVNPNTKEAEAYILEKVAKRGYRALMRYVRALDRLVKGGYKIEFVESFDAPCDMPIVTTT